MATEAKCKRSGHCCKRLVADNVKGLRESVAASSLDEDRVNMTDSFMRGWELSAEAATQAGKKLFTCPFLSNDNVCELQDNKPSICSESLSAKVMQGRSRAPHNFFHHKCGWLDGAPAKLKRAVYLQTASNDLPLGENLSEDLRIEARKLETELSCLTEVKITKRGKYKTKALPLLKICAEDNPSVEYEKESIKE